MATTRVCRGLMQLLGTSAPGCVGGALAAAGAVALWRIVPPVGGEAAGAGAASGGPDGKKEK